MWYAIWGYSSEKLWYNSWHPYILVLPLLGYLLIRNSSVYLTSRYSTFLEFLGRNTLETYVLQFHVFMCREVQHILVLLPGAHLSDANPLMKVVNMLCCGAGFVLLAVEARKATVITQDHVIEVVQTWTGDNSTVKASEALRLQKAAAFQAVEMENSADGGSSSSSTKAVVDLGEGEGINNIIIADTEEKVQSQESSGTNAVQPSTLGSSVVFENSMNSVLTSGACSDGDQAAGDSTAGAKE